MSDVYYKTIVGGIHNQRAVDALVHESSVVLIPGVAQKAHQLRVKIKAQEWDIPFLTAIDAQQEVHQARRKCGINLVTPEFLLKQDQTLFWNLCHHNTPLFRQFLAGDINAI